MVRQLPDYSDDKRIGASSTDLPAGNRTGVIKSGSVSSEFMDDFQKRSQFTGAIINELPSR